MLFLLLACEPAPSGDSGVSDDTGTESDTEDTGEPGETGETGETGDTDTGEKGPCTSLTVAVPPGWGEATDDPALAWSDVAAAGFDCELTFVRLEHGFTVSDLEATGAEVALLISTSGATQQLTQDEVNALVAFIEDGRGVLGTYYWSVGSDGNAGLAPTFGVTLPTSNMVASPKTLAYEFIDHPLGTGLTSPVDPGGYKTAIHIGDDWLVGAEVVAETAESTPARILAYEGADHRAVWLGTFVEYETTTADGHRLLYNSLVWAAGYTP